MSNDGTLPYAGLVGLVGVVAVVSGCLAPGGTAVNDPAAVAERVESRYERLDSLDADLVRTTTRNGHTTTSSGTVQFEKRGSVRVTYDSGPRAGTTAVLDLPATDGAGGTNAAAVEANASEVYGAIAADLVRENAVEYERTTRLDGRRVAVVSLTPRDAPAEVAAGRQVVERRVWVDTERAVPLKLEVTATGPDGRVTRTYRLHNVSVTTDARAGDGRPARGVA